MKRLIYESVLIFISVAVATAWSIIHITPDACWPEYRMLMLIAIGSAIAMLMNFAVAEFVVCRPRTIVGRIAVALILSFVVAGATVRLSIEALLSINATSRLQPSLYCLNNLSSSYLNAYVSIFWSILVCGFALSVVKLLMRAKKAAREAQ